MALPLPPLRPKVSLSLVTWNSARDLADFFDTLEKQTYQDYEVIIIDNASSDSTVEYLAKFQPYVKLIKNEINLGYAAGHNLGIKNSSGEYVLVANPDTRLDLDFIGQLVRKMEGDGRIAAISGKLLKMPPGLNMNITSDILDSTGISCFKNRRFVDRGEGEIDLGQYQKEEEVFGLSGALVLLRRQALEDVKLPNGQYFDEQYFMYREDIDLAWRLRWRKWKNVYAPGARAWHRRSSQSLVRDRPLVVAVKRRKKKSLINRYSYRNHLMTLIKNETFSNLFWWLPWIFWYELQKFFYVLILEPRTLFGLVQILFQLPSLLSKRRSILSHKLADVKEMRRWFV